MKTPNPNQKSILSFFGTSLKGPQINSEPTLGNKRKKTKDDSPIKKSSNYRRRVIESESDEDETETSQVEKDAQPSPVHKKPRLSSPTTSREGKGENENNMNASTSLKKSTVGFSSETVPPLRKTARKNMQRKDGCFEEHQVELVRKLKSPIKDEDGSKCTEMNATEKTKERPRTNSLDKFVYVKPLRKKPIMKENERSTELNSSISSSVFKASNLNGDPCVADEIHGKIDKTPVVTPMANSMEPFATTEQKRGLANSPVPNENSSPLKSISPLSSEQDLNKEKCASFTEVKINSEFDPSKAKYHPLNDASWKRGEDVPFSCLCKTFKAIEGVSGRLKIIEILCNFLRSVIILTPEDMLLCIYLCLNKVAPSFEGIELGIGEIYICRAIAQVTGRSVDKIKSDIAEKGDLGIVAEESKSNQRMMFAPAPLTVKKVFKIVKEVALLGGQASQSKKIDKIKSLLVACKGFEARYLIRFFTGKLRIGLAEQSVLQAIAQACFLTPPEQSYPPEKLNEGNGLSADTLKTRVEDYAAILKKAYCECPSFDLLVPVLLEKGMKELPNYCKLQPGIPLKPMLAHPTKGVSEVFKRFEKSNFTCEFKYDGERAQIHLDEDGNISIFSRNQENNTSKYPDIIARLKKSLGPNVKSCILDSEAVAYDVKEKRILPFQKLSTRKKKDADENDIKVQVCVFPFDLLYLNGRNLVTEPLQIRRSLLRDNFIECDTEFTFAKSLDSDNTEDIEKFLDESIKGNCEGLMVKSLDVDATYEIAKRSRNWLKLKKDYLEGIGDTIDVVIIGGFSGHGNRRGTYGGFLLACYDSESEEYQSLCKIGTGFTDESLQKHTAFFKDHVIETPKSYYRFHSSLTPDHWFEPIQVWEIKCADLSISPVHMAAIGLVDPEKGISLRFPRFLRIREDKSPEDATSAAQIAQLYRSQEQIKNQSDPKENLEEYFY